MKKFTLFMTLFIAATMSIFAQDVKELRLLSTNPSSSEEIEGIGTSWEFIFSEAAKVADNAVKELEIKNEANEVIACVGLTGVGSYENSIFTAIAPIDTVWGEWYDDVTGETIKYVNGYIYPTGLDVPGIYTMTIPAGTFVSAQDNSIAIAETTLTFNVIAPKPNPMHPIKIRPHDKLGYGRSQKRRRKIDQPSYNRLFNVLKQPSALVGGAEQKVHRHERSAVNRAKRQA